MWSSLFYYGITIIIIFISLCSAVLCSFSLYRQREVSKRELVARFESEQITILKNCAAELATLKQSSHCLRHRFSIIVSVTFLSRYCNYKLLIINY